MCLPGRLLHRRPQVLGQRGHPRGVLGEQAERLDVEGETLRGPVRPRGRGLLRGQRVIGGVHFHQRELARVVAEAFFGLFASGGYQPDSIRVLSVHDAVPTRISATTAASARRGGGRPGASRNEAGQRVLVTRAIRRPHRAKRGWRWAQADGHGHRRRAAGPGGPAGRCGTRGAAGRCEWSPDGRGAGTPACASRARSPWPFTHSGSGPSSGRPVKNLAAMQPPRQESYAEQDVHAPPPWGWRSSANSGACCHTVANPPGPRTLPARKLSWMANGQAYTSPTGLIRHTTRPAPHRLRPGSDSPNAARWKKESPVRTCSPRATSQSYRSRCCCAVGCSSSQTSAPRPDGRSRVSRSWAPNRSASALKASSWPALCRVTTTEILNPAKPAAARLRIAASAVAYEPAPRTASLTSAVAPSREICTST